MLSVMAKRKPKSRAVGQPDPPTAPKKPNRTGLQLNVFLPRKYRLWLDALAQRNDRTITKEVVRALEAHFRSEGIDPDSEPPPVPDAD
jgi:hypothetical protein